MTKPRIITLCCALLAGIAGPAAAQAPSISGITPPGGQIGTGPQLKIGGANLTGATSVVVSGEGVDARIDANNEGGNLPVTLAISPNALPGAREVRVVTPLGTSNAGRIWLSGYGTAVEKEPNNTLAQGQELDSVPVTVSGLVSGSEDIDTYTFYASAGEATVVDLAALRIGSPLDGYLALFDARGRPLQHALEGFDRDPRLIFTPKQSGKFTVQVRDTLFRNGGNFAYSLTIGKVPVVTGFLPRAGKRGETVNVQLQGVNMGSMSTIAVSIPMQGDPEPVAPATADGRVIEPIRLEASDLPEWAESEPNDSLAQAMALPAAPGAVSGRIDKDGDVDYFKIKPTAAGSLQFDVEARRDGSRLDSDLKIYDTAGKELSSSNDSVGKDSRTSVTVQANTEYVVQIGSADGHGGSGYFYRLVMAPPPGPDFSVQVSPDVINIPKGGSAALTVTLTRQNGFGGAVSFRLDDAPAGLTLNASDLRAGANTTTFTVSAGPQSEANTWSRVRLVAVGNIGGKQVERVAEPGETYPMPLAPQANQTLRRPTQLFAAAVTPQAPFVLVIEQPEIKAKKGTQGVEIKVKAIRQMGVTEQINLTVENQPANVAPVLANIAANKDEAVLKLNIAANAPEGLSNLIIKGTRSGVAQTAPALPLTITP